MPLIIRAPKQLPAGTGIPENVNLVDLFATLCELSGVETPDGLDSRSLVPLARGEDAHWPDDSLSFFLQQGYRNGMIKQGSRTTKWFPLSENN